ncbi:hypothetical protein EON65_32415 [archaeon]|nr:MAG: hypothetical protein EON65_32415 [archaeon]
MSDTAASSFFNPRESLSRRLTMTKQHYVHENDIIHTLLHAQTLDRLIVCCQIVGVNVHEVKRKSCIGVVLLVLITPLLCLSMIPIIGHLLHIIWHCFEHAFKEYVLKHVYGRTLAHAVVRKCAALQIPEHFLPISAKNLDRIFQSAAVTMRTSTRGNPAKPIPMSDQDRQAILKVLKSSYDVGYSYRFVRLLGIPVTALKVKQPKCYSIGLTLCGCFGFRFWYGQSTVMLNEYMRILEEHNVTRGEVEHIKSNFDDLWRVHVFSIFERADTNCEIAVPV